MMVTSWIWLAAIGPILLILAGMAQRGGSVRQAGVSAGWAGVAAVAVFCSAVIVAAAVIVYGTLTSGSLGFAGIGFGIYVDGLSAAMFALVSFVGAIVVRFSRNYLDGDGDHAGFTRRLCLTLASVLLMILSGNFFQFALAWVATSLCLHGLLTFYRNRPAAMLAARKKFLASRVGDACLLVAMVLLYQLFGSLDFSAIFAGAEGLRGHDLPGSVHAIAVLIVIAALLKSGQFPMHGWLTEVMEAPTPVSALLHAGIINAGGFLILRMANVVSLSTPSLDTLAVVGGFTALFGSLVMLTQTSVKVSLAYSTIAQMGFMMLQCGLGAFSAALLHIVAHSLYKAHAFLSSGSVIDIYRASWSPSPGGQPHPARLVVAIVLVLAVAPGVSMLFGATLTERPGVFVLGAVMLLGLVHLIANGIDERPSGFILVRTLSVAGVVAIAYFALQAGAEWLMAGSLPQTAPLRGQFELAIVLLVIVSFGALTLFQGLLPHRMAASRWQGFYALVSNGFYVNTLANRWVLKFWPASPRPPRATSNNLGPGDRS